MSAKSLAITALPKYLLPHTLEECLVIFPIPRFLAVDLNRGWKTVRSPGIISLLVDLGKALVFPGFNVTQLFLSVTVNEEN